MVIVGDAMKAKGTGTYVLVHGENMSTLTCNNNKYISNCELIHKKF